MRSSFAAVDLGNSSARVIIGIITDDRIDIGLTSRVPNAPVRRDDGWHWISDRLSGYVRSSLECLSTVSKLRGISIDSWGVDCGLLDERGELIGEPYSYFSIRLRATGVGRRSTPCSCRAVSWSQCCGPV